MTDNSPSSGAGEVTALAFDKLPSASTMLWRGLTRRCPWCGDRKAYFTGWFSRQEKCCKCGHGYRRGDDAFELGAITANIILTFIVVLLGILVLAILTLPDIPVVPAIIIGSGGVFLLPALFYPVSFTLWQSIDLIMRGATEDELAGRGDSKL